MCVHVCECVICAYVQCMWTFVCTCIKYAMYTYMHTCMHACMCFEVRHAFKRLCGCVYISICILLGATGARVGLLQTTTLAL